MKKKVETIGRSVTIKGELSATQDLTIEGQVEGKIALDNNVLTIGPEGRIDAPVLAKVVNVMGKVDGTITATEAINVRETATVDGALVAPRVGIEDGALVPRPNRHQRDHSPPAHDQATKAGEAAYALLPTTGRQFVLDDASRGCPGRALWRVTQTRGSNDESSSRDRFASSESRLGAHQTKFSGPSTRPQTPNLVLSHSIATRLNSSGFSCCVQWPHSSIV